ncbi:MAG: glycosyltransferase family 2 protein [Clostridiales bacterium]|nr:glycosyltransferase family 2 protein [Clostridiales bacterium]
MKKISVIIPVYNSEKTLERCLNSVIVQTHKDYEVILVDDGSKDNSLNICFEFAKKDSRIKVVHKENGGPSSARNKGLSVSEGQYVSFIDSDDSIDSDFLEKLIQGFENKGVDLVISAIRIEGFKNKFVGFNENAILEKNKFNRFFTQDNFYGLMSSSCNKLYLREKIKHYFPEDIHNGEDAIFNINYLRSCQKIVLTNDISYNYYYENKESLTKRYTDKRFDDMLKTSNILKEYFIENKIDSNKIIGRLILRDVCSITKSLMKSNKFSNDEKRKRVKNFLNNEIVIASAKQAKSVGVAEKIAFYLIKNKMSRLFMFCCKVFN